MEMVDNNQLQKSINQVKRVDLIIIYTFVHHRLQC